MHITDDLHLLDRKHGLKEEDSAKLSNLSPRVAVLLASYNGARFIDEQISSIEAQDVPHIDLWIADDLSTDGTMDILRSWQERWTKGRIRTFKGPGRGFSANFRFLMGQVSGEYGAYCFSDQDDVWHADHISRAIDTLTEAAAGAALYGARTRLTNVVGEVIGYSPLFRRPKSFRNALVQSMAGGNTMVMNAPAFALIQESARRTNFVSHDWWAYIVVTGAGGAAIYDPMPSVDYRQHESNVVGKNSGLKAWLKRAIATSRGQLRSWTDQNLSALDTCYDLLTPEARDVIARWRNAHERPAPLGVYSLLRSGVYRQTKLGSFMLVVSGILGWI